MNNTFNKIILFSAFTSFISWGQIKIGDNPTVINNSALLEIESTKRGLILSRMSSIQRDAIVNPVEGLVIYNNTTSQIEFYNGSGWGRAGFNIYDKDGTIKTNRVLNANGNTFAISNLDTDKAFTLSSKTTDIFSVDALTSAVGILNNTPKEALDVSGNIIASGNLISNTFSSQWDALKNYQTEDVVLHKGLFYSSLANANKGNDPSSNTANTKWQQVGASIYNSEGSLSQNRNVNQNDKTLTFTTDNTKINAFSIDESTFSIDAKNNRVGIGTINPKETLEVSGNIKSNTFATAWSPGIYNINNVVLHNGLFYKTINTTTSADGNPNIATNKWQQVGASIYNIDSNLSNDRNVNQNGKTLSFNTDNTKINAFSVDGNTLSIDAKNNRIGIGTINPKQTLDVIGKANFSNDISSGGNINGVNLIATGETRSLGNLSINTDKTIIDANTGNINTKGDIYADGILKTSTFSTSWNSTKKYGPNNLVIYNGNIYRNLTSSTGSAPDIDIVNWKNIATSRTLYYADGVLSSNRTISQNDKSLSFIMDNTNTNAFTIDVSTFNVDAKNNRVGIGTINPTESLHVSGDMRLTGMLKDHNNQKGSFGQVLSSSPSGIDWIDPVNLYTSNGTLSENRTIHQNDKILIFTATNPNAFSIDGPTFSVDAFNNRVGIGTINPTQTLTVRGSTELSDANASYINYFPWIDNDVYITGKNVRIRTGASNSERVHINENGFMGVGTTNPTHQLHVSGDLRVTGTIRDSSNDVGVNGQVLSSTGSGTNWVNLQAESSPIGTMSMYVGQVTSGNSLAPITSGKNIYLVANGATFNRSTYPDLYSALGNSTTLPDMRGVFPRGVDGGRNLDRGRRVRSYQNQATAPNGMSVAGLIKNGWNQGNIDYVNGPWAQGSDRDGSDHGNISIKLIGGSNETRPVNVAVNFIIKAR